MWLTVLCRSAKEFESSFHILYECDDLAAHHHFFLGLGRLDPKNNGNTHPILFLAFSKALGLG
jgi:hypothetical protein